MSELVARPWIRPLSRRTLVLLVVAGVLLVLGFYSATDPERLAHDPGLGVADYAGYAVCHRITSRSFTVAGRQFPLCARCTGMYLGVTLTFLALWLAGRRRWSDLPPRAVLLVLLGLVGLMGIDGINSYSHFFPGLPHVYEPRNWLRLVTGMGTGLAMGAIVFPGLAQTLWQDQERRPALGSLRELLGLMVVAAVVVLLVLSNQPVILYVLAIASAAGVVIILAGINCMMLLILSKRDARATNWRQAAVPLAIGVLLAVGQIAAASLLRYALTGALTGIPGVA
ncbi:MAG: DUF2085 domain-containing protein [Chloroflexi bacterium]|nr:DUF2085 domain-containing protein [Chloroflexota bacterium]MCI0580415.1 DUF2085 domain-containing protein [Chloroflexota bacterium]MCI0647289.1 DUF2085 domain-containing protein [Chloroflexota bacterium]MCI0729716.1 DUF2085 domain-containing protein [Chloroflexota bacterium]